MTQHAQNIAYSFSDLDNVVFQNIATKHELVTSKQRIEFLSTQLDDSFLSLKQTADYCKLSKRTIQRQRDVYQFPNPAAGRSDYIKRHLDFYIQFGGEAWHEIIAKHTRSDIASFNTTTA